MSWLWRLSQQQSIEPHPWETYLNIAHNVEDYVLWFHNGQRLFASDEFQSHTYWPEFQTALSDDTLQAQGRIDLEKNVGSCTLFISDSRLQKIILNDLISDFPHIRFTIYKLMTDANAYPNPEGLQSFYEKIAAVEFEKV